MAWEDEEEIENILDSAEDLTEEEMEDYEEFIEEFYEIGDETTDFDGPTVEMTLTLANGDSYTTTIPAEYIPDLVEFCDELDIEFEIDS